MYTWLQLCIHFFSESCHLCGVQQLLMLNQSKQNFHDYLCLKELTSVINFYCFCGVCVWLSDVYFCLWCLCCWTTTWFLSSVNVLWNLHLIKKFFEMDWTLTFAAQLHLAILKPNSFADKCDEHALFCSSVNAEHRRDGQRS